MTLKRLIAIALTVALLMRVWPMVAPWVWPSLKPKVERLKLRADVGTALVMVALAVATVLQGERAWAVVVGLLAIPSIVAVVRALRGR